MITLEKLCEIINENFGEPFLVKDGVSAEIYETDHGVKELSINIGRRDIQINEQGEVLNAGTLMDVPGDVLSFDLDD